MVDKPVERPMERYLRRSGSEPGAATSCFESGDRPYLMLDLIFQDGNRLGLSYCYLMSVRFDDGTRITLAFTDHTIIIEGRNLGPLYNHLLLHQAWRISVATSPFSDASEAWVKTMQAEKIGGEKQAA